MNVKIKECIEPYAVNMQFNVFTMLTKLNLLTFR